MITMPIGVITMPIRAITMPIYVITTDRSGRSRWAVFRSLAGPGMLAMSIVHRLQDHQPLHRLESIYARDGLDISRSTLCGWHEQLADLAEPLVEAMLVDAFAQPYLCTDATGVLVQAAEQCQRAHFWVLVAPERHVLYRFSHKHDSDAVDRLLAGYKGYLVADAASA